MKKKIEYLCSFVLVVCILFCFATTTQAATDKKKPSVKITLGISKPTNSSIKIKVKASDTSGIRIVRWASGAKKANYMKKSGKKIKLNKKKIGTITIKKNGVYTFYVKDNANNIRIKKLRVTNIDKVNPVITVVKSNLNATNKNVQLMITVTDNGTGIKNLKFLSGKKSADDFVNAGDELVITKTGTANVNIETNGKYSLYAEDLAGNKTSTVVTVENIDKVLPVITPEYSVMNQKATVKTKAVDNDSGLKRIIYRKGTLTDVNSAKWAKDGTYISDFSDFKVNSDGNYSILAEDLAGNKSISTISISLEMKAMWISFLEFSSKGYTEGAFKEHINKMFDNCVKWNMNTVIVQVTPFGDAMFQSSYFPWSTYVSGTQGKNPGYDPLKIMIEAAHGRNLEFHAWLNPYRISSTGTDVGLLANNHQARKWRESSSKIKNRNVLTFSGKLYYNPAKKDVQNLIVNGIKEIVQNYDVDGIHFDDYFYPSLDATKYTSTFDATEYKEYVLQCSENGTTAKSIVNWRRGNVNTLVKRVYSSIKNINPDVQFGISPAGNIDNLMAKNKYYVDIKTWLSSSSYVDYICPQIYWSFTNKICPFAETVDRWLSIRTSDTVNMYIGIPVYRAGSNIEPEYLKSTDVIKRQVEYGRNTGKVDGCFYFRYAFFQNKTTKKEVENLLDILD